MDPFGIAVAASTLVLSLIFAVFRRHHDGRFRTPPRDITSDTLRSIAAGQLTFVQFSGEVCAQCKTNQRVFTQTLDGLTSVQFTDVPVDQHMELVRSLGIMRSPTVLLIEPSGEIIARAQGVVKKQTILDLIGKNND